MIKTSYKLPNRFSDRLFHALVSKLHIWLTRLEGIEGIHPIEYTCPTFYWRYDQEADGSCDMAEPVLTIYGSDGADIEIWWDGVYEDYSQVLISRENYDVAANLHEFVSFEKRCFEQLEEIEEKHNS